MFLTVFLTRLGFREPRVSYKLLKLLIMLSSLRVPSVRAKIGCWRAVLWSPELMTGALSLKIWEAPLTSTEGPSLLQMEHLPQSPVPEPCGFHCCKDQWRECTAGGA